METFWSVFLTLYDKIWRCLWSRKWNVLRLEWTEKNPDIMSYFSLIHVEYIMFNIWTCFCPTGSNLFYSVTRCFLSTVLLRTRPAGFFRLTQALLTCLNWCWCWCCAVVGPVVEGGSCQDHRVLIGPFRRVAPGVLQGVPEVASRRIADDAIWKTLPHQEGKIHLKHKEDSGAVRTGPVLWRTSIRTSCFICVPHTDLTGLQDRVLIQAQHSLRLYGNMR